MALSNREQELSNALDWIERNVPGGIQIVAAAMVNVPPNECPALVQIVQKLGHRPYQCECPVCALNRIKYRR